MNISSNFISEKQPSFGMIEINLRQIRHPLLWEIDIRSSLKPDTVRIEGFDDFSSEHASSICSFFHQLASRRACVMQKDIIDSELVKKLLLILNEAKAKLPLFADSPICKGAEELLVNDRKAEFREGYHGVTLFHRGMV